MGTGYLIPQTHTVKSTLEGPDF